MWAPRSSTIRTARLYPRSPFRAAYALEMCTEYNSPVVVSLHHHPGQALAHRVPRVFQVGTTVTITDLFSRLPVRHKQLQKNAKKEACAWCTSACQGL
jgi:DNA mismatch repair ATPase MutL